MSRGEPYYKRCKCQGQAAEREGHARHIRME